MFSRACSQQLVYKYAAAHILPPSIRRNGKSATNGVGIVSVTLRGELARRFCEVDALSLTTLQAVC